MKLQWLTTRDNVEDIVSQIQPEKWGADNDMASYNQDSLRTCLENNGHILIAFEDEKIVGCVLGYLLAHPGGDDSFYVHELDVHPSHRGRHIAREMMMEVFSRANNLGAKEVWVATEHDNQPAIALYTSLNPNEVATGPVYAYTMPHQ